MKRVAILYERPVPNGFRQDCTGCMTRPAIICASVFFLLILFTCHALAMEKPEVQTRKSETAKELYEKAQSYWKSGEYTKALALLRIALRKDPTYVAAWRLTAACESQLGHQQEAIDAMKETVRIKPDDMEEYQQLASYYSGFGRDEEAIETIKQAIQRNSGFERSYLTLGLRYSLLGKHHDAIDAYRKAIEINPSSFAAYHYLGTTFVTLKLYGEAIESYKQSLRLKTDSPWAFDDQLDLGDCYSKLGGRDKEAIDAFKEAIRIDPHKTEAHVSLAMRYFISEHYQEAVTALGEAVRIIPDWPAGHLLLGEAYSHF